MSWIKSIRWSSFLLHAIFWLLFFSFPFILHPDLLSTETTVQFIIYFYVIKYATWVGFFYFNANVLVPKYIYSKKYLSYILAQVLLIGGLCLFHVILFSNTTGHIHLTAPILFTVSPYIFIWACSTVYQLIRHKIKTDKSVNEKEKENLKTELSFLRSQISPHFMFNMLNNMVSLARKKSDQLEPSLIKFSSLLRYMVYETNEDKKPLAKEIEYLESFIELQQLRFGKNIVINISLQKENINYSIEPMLLIPFAENAFKHGIVFDDTAFITVTLTVENDTLRFYVKNKYNSLSKADKTGGIGLTNVTRRLQLLYDRKHKLNIDRSGEWFTVSLELNLL